MLGMDTTSPESGPSHPREEKALAIWGAVIGAIVGAAAFAFIFFIPTLFLQFRYEGLIVVVGAVLGIIHGGSAGPAVALRMSQWWEKKLPNMPHRRGP